MCAADARTIRRYVAIGDSSTEGLDDRRPDGSYRGWSERLAQRLYEHSGALEYANLAVRGRRTHEVRTQQLPLALAMRPELITIFSGTNDLLGWRFDAASLEAHFDAMFAAAHEAGALALTFTLPDLTSVMPVARGLRGRIAALDDAIRRAAARHGALCVDLAALPVAGDPRLWSEDRIHANAAGHARIAAALAEALQLPGADDAWRAPLAPIAADTWLAACGSEVRWWRRHLLPWIAAAIRGANPGDGRRAKRPVLKEFA